MPAFHHFLDKIFAKRLTFSVFFRIWLAFAVIVMFASGLAIYQLQKSIKPSAQKVVEDTLVDISRTLATTLSPAVASGDIRDLAFQQQLNQAFSPNGQTAIPTWFDQKTHSQLHVYVTDSRGVVLYDSQGVSVGKDFSRWNDVYLTLHGKYGARSTRVNPRDEASSVMYVASPIVDNTHQLIGVVSVGKPILTLLPYIDKSREEMFKTMLYITVICLVLSGLMAWWLRHSIQTVNRYTQNLANDPPPHFYLGKELNQLVTTIDEMKNTIENKAYVTEYVHTLTHELKSPLTAIRASGELLGDELPPANREQFSQTIIEQSDKLQTLVEKLLVIAKLEQPSFKLSQQLSDVKPLIQTLITAQQAKIQQKNLQLNLQFDTQNQAYIDSFWLSQALQNGIDNAIKFAKHHVMIITERTPQALRIHIINDSPTLPDYILQKAFERYFSVNLAEQHNKGTGLGLTLAKQVVERHQGNAIGSIGLQQLENDVDKNNQNWDKQPQNNKKLDHLIFDKKTPFSLEKVNNKFDGNLVILTIQLPTSSS
ncbi:MULTISPECIES: two-component system sensor histidine kinase CreC [unclassified Moraxella]|uniref:two-component system sensor histidine kinase CreC n=1 Tax=unclassified Moraxella TaxID=2685852 RepID=UPI003AF87867